MVLLSHEKTRSQQTIALKSVLLLDTMVRERVFLLTVTCSVLMLLVRCDDFLEIRSPGDNMKAQEEKELIEALQEVLEKLRNKQIPTAEKKFGWVPSGNKPTNRSPQTLIIHQIHFQSCCLNIKKLEGID
ncbi:uncharacterized protein cart1 isoform X2 [Pimephales promelas]|uniref:uncharacterized protein cart1 isoform X2 n=1 Tax=Pimephales promelas TaxID=90988 RepID=UPI001955815A|nr:uncharacterized protein cart1 isoform X2 [Pimephales promelas]